MPCSIMRSHRLRFVVLVPVLLILGFGCRLSSQVPSAPQAPEPARTTRTPDRQTPTPTPMPTPADEPALLHQWAVSGIDGWDTDNWMNAVGAPDADDSCAIYPGESWVYHSDPWVDRDFLQLFYARPVNPTEVRIHLAYTHSAITRVTLMDVDGHPHEVYLGEPEDLDTCPSVITITLDDFSTPVYAVRIDVATLWDNAGITVIDAVELVGMVPDMFVATPEPTPYVTVSSLGTTINDLPAGFAQITIIDRNADQTLLESACDAFWWNLTEDARTIRFFSCDDASEVWLYLPVDLQKGDMPLNSYSFVPSGRLYYNDHFIPAMEGFGAIDRLSETHISGVMEFWGFDPENNIDYYKVVLVFNHIPLDERASWKPGDMIIQWAETAVASSAQGEEFYSAAQAAGPSDTWVDCEDAPTAWMPLADSGQAWIELRFEVPVYPQELTLLLTGDPAGVASVDLLLETDFWPLDVASARLVPGCPTALTFIGLGEVDAKVSGVMVRLDYLEGAPKPGIDAVQLIGVMAE
jgi:hypothetical protein